MITLITYAPSFGQPAASPFCIKAIWLLNMSGLAWEREDTADPRKMPKQKLPAIRIGSDIIPDSDNIRTYLEAQGAEKNLSASLESRTEDDEDLGSPPNVGTFQDAKNTRFFDPTSAQTINR